MAVLAAAVIQRAAENIMNGAAVTAITAVKIMSDGSEAASKQ